MNKSAEQQAEERYQYAHPSTASEDHESFDYWNMLADIKRKAFIAGHQSRDEEVKKLVEVLDELLKDRIWEPNWDIAKEAIKPYQK